MTRKSKETPLRSIDFLSSWKEEEIIQIKDGRSSRSSSNCDSPSLRRKTAVTNDGKSLKNELHFQRIRNSPVIRRKILINMRYKTAEGTEVEIQLPHSSALL